MDSYCVIHFKDKQEQGKILNFLTSETVADFKVTADLKEYVAKLFNVIILEKNEISSENIVVTPPISTLPTEQQHSSAPIVPPPPIDINLFDQQDPVVEQLQRWIDTTTIKNEIDDTVEDVAPVFVPSKLNNNLDISLQNLINMDDYGTYIPHQDRMVEPKEEIMDDPEESIATKENNPSSSSISGKITKRPIYSMDDYLTNYTNMPEAKKKPNNNQESVTKKENTVHTCQKCGTVYRKLRDREYHVMMHAKIMKYKCLVSGCGYKVVERKNIVRHMDSKHFANSESFGEIELTDDQMEKLKEVRKECYPGSSNTCQVCHSSIGGKCGNIAFTKRQHALQHIDFMLYKCMEKGCQFESKTHNSMIVHVLKVHGEQAREHFRKNELTKEQELEIEEMVIKCFPNIDTEVDDPEQ